ncbi:hypothetical protein EMPS_06692 [Entomortierella parvispora]|uniref:Crinkler effector protein N-terminal domain-containing protein n=1 Tax=Entomortierella parvispora TaxID=205924 RepID=A0A9P3LXN7_9FUNG|nr:hypothetical protein EMPS_06692 [Entomortierella parvispora]
MANNAMASNTETNDYWWVLNGETTRNSVKVSLPLTADVSDLKNKLKEENSKTFDGFDAPDIILWKWPILPAADDGKTPVTVKGLAEEAILHPKALLASQSIINNKSISTYIIVQRLKSDLKRDHEDDEGSLSKKSRLDLDDAVVKAIKAAGFENIGLVEGEAALSELNNEQRRKVVEFMGKRVGRRDPFRSLTTAALKLRGADFKAMDKMSAPDFAPLPVVKTNDLYIRQTYRDLYNIILEKFGSIDPEDPDPRNHIVAAGTSGIGKSAFLVYFAVRLLAESYDNDPPIIIFQTKQSTECYVFGGCNTVRSGNIADFLTFLQEPDTWYLVDSSLDPRLEVARTIISASPKTLQLNADYDDIDKRVDEPYYMAPWSLEELQTCRERVKGFQVVPSALVAELYSQIGGVPRYVLERPMSKLKGGAKDLRKAKESACKRVNAALDAVKDSTVLLKYFQEGRDSLEFSSRLIHRWPLDEDHSKYTSEWASEFIRDKVASQLEDDALRNILKALMNNPGGSGSGLMFEAFVLRAFREGGHTFELKELETGEPAELTHLKIPLKPVVNTFLTITGTKPDQLWIPKICNFACVDFLFSCENLFQVTVSGTHPIKGQLFSELIDSLKQRRWIKSPAEARLIFVVPEHIFDGFPKQKYHTTKGHNYKDIRSMPGNIRSVKQFVMKISVASAAAGKSPGLDLVPTKTKGRLQKK